jgi:hypothetical protein
MLGVSTESHHAIDPPRDRCSRTGGGLSLMRLLIIGPRGCRVKRWVSLGWRSPHARSWCGGISRTLNRSRFEARPGCVASARVGLALAVVAGVAGCGGGATSSSPAAPVEGYLRALVEINRQASVAGSPLYSALDRCLSERPSRRGACLGSVAGRPQQTAKPPAGVIEACRTLSPNARRLLVSRFAKPLSSSLSRSPIATLSLGGSYPRSGESESTLVGALGAEHTAASWVMDSPIAFGTRDWAKLRVDVVRETGVLAAVRVASSAREVTTRQLDGSWQIEALDLTGGRARG